MVPDEEEEVKPEEEEEEIEEEIIILGDEEEEEEEESSEPKVYVIKIPPGREIALAFLIRHRARLLDLPIYSVFKPRSQDGILFVESTSYNAVVSAAKEFRYAYVFREPLSISDAERYLEEFLRSERAEKEEKGVEIVPGMVVEIVNGPFRGQKARVVSVDKKRVWVDLMAGGALLVSVSIDDIRPTNISRK